MDSDDLSEFRDYLAEFSASIKFDSETCPICGISLSSSLSINKIPLLELQFENEQTAEKAISILEEKGIKSKQSSSDKEKILIHEEKLEEVKAILNSK